jgi:hypothetical protein
MLIYGIDYRISCLQGDTRKHLKISRKYFVCKILRGGAIASVRYSRVTYSTYRYTAKFMGRELFF